MMTELETQCPNCKHSFTHAHQIASLGASPATTIRTQMNLLPQFRDLLSDEAKKVYDVKVPSTVIETLFCPTCEAETLITDEMRDKIHANSVAQLLGKESEVVWDHEHTDDRYRRCHLVGFLGGPLSVSLLYASMEDAALQRALDRRLKVMAHVVNCGVAEGWLAFSVMTDAFYVELASFSMKQSIAPFLYIGTRTPTVNDPIKWLNSKVGNFGLFLLEGELGNEEAWNEYAAHNNL